MAQSPESVKIQATVGNVAAGAQLAFGTKIVQIGHVSGGIVNILNEAPPPPRLKPQPVSLRPKPFRDLLDRVTETTDITNALESQESVECIGESGYGKTTLLRHLAHQAQLSTFAAGVVYFQVNQQSDADLLKSLFDAFYTCDFPIKPTETEIRSYLQSVNALILLDDVNISAEQIKTLINNAPNCTFIVVNKERSLFGETREVTLKGLPVADAVRLFRRELGRELSAEEEKQARLLCESLGCVPLPVLRAAHKAREEKRSVAAVVEEPKTAFAAAEIEPCTEDEKKILAALAVFRGAPVAAEHMASIAEVPGAQQVLDDLEQRGLVQSHEQTYTLASDVTTNLLGDPTPWFKRALAHFVSWTEEKRSKPELIAGSAQPILVVLKWAVTNHSWSEVNQLGHAIEEALTLAGKWDMWATVLESVEAAAAAQKDLAETAWSLHQLGTRALLLDNRSTARASLRQALAIRERLNDETGAAITRHNLNLLLGPVPPKPDSEKDGAGTTTGPKPSWLKVGAIGLVGLALLIAVMVWIFKPSNSPVILPKVISLSVTPDLVPANGEAQLCYEVANAERVVIQPNIGERRPATKECLRVTAGETTTYTLTVFGPNGSTTSQNVVLNVEPPAPKAEIVRFEVLRKNGPGGGADVQFQLCYDVRNAAHAEIDNDVGGIVLGQDRCQQIKPQQTTTYTLTATGSDGRVVTRQATVDATKPPAPLPQILSFDAPETIKSNESAELCFQVKEATTAQIDPGARQISITSTRQCVKVKPSQTTKYTLTVFNAEGKEASKDKTITVVYPPGIVFFKTDTNDVRPGDAIKMCYRVENARRLQVDNGVGDVKPVDEGCFETTIGTRANVAVNEVRSFTLTATGPDGQTSTSELKIRLSQQAVEITEFTVTPQRITRGDSVSFCYQTENATGINIEPRVVRRQRAQNGRIVCIEHKPAATTTYTLTALNSLGVTPPTRQAAVIVDEPKPKHVRVDRFQASSPRIKPGESVRLCYGVADARRITISPFRKEFPNSDENCFDDSPRQSITYVLTATGEDGQTERREVRVEVDRVITPPVKILRFAIEVSHFPAAFILQVCYTLENAQSARIDQDIGELTNLTSDCLPLKSRKSATYTLTATGADGTTVQATATYPPSDRRLVPRVRPRPRPTPGSLLR